MIFVLVSLFILTSYVVAVCWRWGIPNSVSQSFFSIRHKWIFSACVAVSFGLMFMPMTDALPLHFEFLAFLTCAGGLFVAFAPNLNDVLERKVHMAGAIVLGVASQTIVAQLYPDALLLWFGWLALIFDKRRVFWAEMLGGLALYIAVIADYYMV